nr:4'-phosphopantetheinyl transferase superfamily protein [Geodermatophilus sabuli]
MVTATPVRPGPLDADVALWLVDLAADDDALTAAEARLTPVEVARAHRGTPAVHRRRVLLRAALRSALGSELGIPPGQVPIGTSPAGRPHLAVRGSLLDVSCSASGAVGVVAVGRGRRVGVDVELVAPWSSDVLDEGWLSPGERRALTGLPVTARPLAVTRCWTQKEAVLKATGTGLRADPATVVTPVGRATGAVAGWEIRDVQVPDGWVASLAVTPEEETPR